MKLTLLMVSNLSIQFIHDIEFLCVILSFKHRCQIRFPSAVKRP